MDDLVIGSLTIPAGELEERFETSGGPGGQHANRSNTAVVLRFDVAASSVSDEVKTRLISRLGTVVETRASDTRSQTRNRELARERMAEKIASAMVVRKRRRKTRPTTTAREKRLTDKKARSEVKKARRRPSGHD